MRVIYSIVVATFFMLLSGCVSMGIDIPENFQDNLPDSAILNVKRIGQYDDFSCATTSLAMVISYYENDREIWKQDMWDASGSSIHIVKDGGGNDMNGLERAAEKYGYKNYRFVSNLSMDKLKYLISNDIPVVVNIKNFFMDSDHAVVVTGYDNENIFIADPARPGGGKYSVSYKKFLKHWHAHLSSPQNREFRHSAFILYRDTDMLVN